MSSYNEYNGTVQGVVLEPSISTITNKQEQFLTNQIVKSSQKLKDLLTHFKIEKLSDLPSGKMDDALTWLDFKKR